MSDIRELAAPLIAHPLVAPPAIEEVVLRVHRARARRRRRKAVVASALLVIVGSARWTADIQTDLASGRVETPEAQVDVVEPAPGTPNAGSPIGGPEPPGATGPQPDTKFGPNGPLPPGIACQGGKNGGATDRGVSATKIKLFMNVAVDGPAASRAHEVVRQLANEVNRVGGICGRMLAIEMRNGWYAPPDDALAMLSSPLKTELDADIRSGAVARRGVPVVGTDGLTAVQHSSPWVWPVGTSLAAQARIAVHDAFHRDRARTFAMVHDQDQASLEAAAAFREHVTRLGGTVRIVHAADDGVIDFNAACAEGRCDAVVLALGPSGFAEWRNGRPASARLRTAGLSRMVGDVVPEHCAALLAPDRCENLTVWTPYTPPLTAFRANPEVARYGNVVANDLNPLTEGAYVGMSTLIDALKRVGPVVTRERLRAALNDNDYRSGLVDLLRWTPANRSGNVSARGLRVSSGSFADAGTGWVRDPMGGLR